MRAAGSGNIGATNVARTAGLRLGIATLVADTLKGALPAVAARALGTGATIEAAAGLTAFFGHVFPVTLGFRGGKGVATAFGALLVLCPLTAGIATGVFVAALAAARYVSLASMLAALAAPPAAALLGYPSATVATAA